MTEALDAARDALAANDVQATADAFFALVRDAIRIAAKAEDDHLLGSYGHPLKLGNVSFWVEDDTLVYFPGTAQWDRTALNATLTRVLQHSTLPDQPRGDHAVLFLNGRSDSPLLVKNIRRDVYGALKQGWVVNGEWSLGIKDGVGSCNGEPGQPIDSIVEIPVPEEFSWSYDRAIAWAREQPTAPVEAVSNEAEAPR